jgi:hypothetical protein
MRATQKMEEIRTGSPEGDVGFPRVGEKSRLKLNPSFF